MYGELDPHVPSSPQAWGCFVSAGQAQHRVKVFPTGVGVFRDVRRPGENWRRLPHRRGGVSHRAPWPHRLYRSSPQAWGCFDIIVSRDGWGYVFPTGVGVFRTAKRRGRGVQSLPHRRGGVSPTFVLSYWTLWSSPQAWGCFAMLTWVLRHDWVFPTGVGVFRDGKTIAIQQFGLPHRRGGVSQRSPSASALRVSSPQAWGCFALVKAVAWLDCVFPTGVGVFRKRCCRSRRCGCLPHRRGGVSGCADGGVPLVESSPQAWGCFAPRLRRGAPKTVFPTGVGVFRYTSSAPVLHQCLPHRRGGVSPIPRYHWDSKKSSPQAWGCFVWSC